MSMENLSADKKYLIQCVNAYAALQPLMDQEWDYKTAHALMMLKRRLQPHASFFSQEEMKLAEEFAEKDEDGKIQWKGTGRFAFQDPSRSQEYAGRRMELGMVEVQEAWNPIRASVPASIKPAQLEALEGFIEFYEEETT